jgi:hypothetical protein
MRAKFNELERKCLDLLEKIADGEEVGEMEEYALNSIIELSRESFNGKKSAVKRFFAVVDRLLQTEGL